MLLVSLLLFFAVPLQGSMDQTQNRLLQYITNPTRTATVT